MLYAAVVIPIVMGDEPAIVFVRRASHLRRNPGQIAFPGGLVDPADADGRAAALREFEEELGVAPGPLRIVDALPDVVTLSRTVTVTPYLGLWDGAPAFVADERETESVHLVPLSALYEPGALHEGAETIRRDGGAVEVPSWLFDYGPLHVWGATARMLRGLVTRYPSAAAILRLPEAASRARVD